MRRSIRNCLLAFGLVILLPGVAFAQAVVVSFGDSITTGSPYQSNLNGGRGGAYPGELERLLLLANPGACIVVRNYGISGENTYEAAARVDNVLAQSRPRWVTIMLGTNDLWTGISANSTAANIGFLIDRVRAWGAKPIVSNLLPSNYSGHPGHLIPTWYNPAIEQVIASREAVFNDAYAVFSPQWAATSIDGLHPNYNGYVLLGQTFCASMKACAGNQLRSLSPTNNDSRALPWLDILLGDASVGQY